MPGQRPQARKDEKTGKFGQASLEAKRQAAIAALRAERGVAPVSETVPETLSTQAQMAAVHSVPNSDKYAAQGLTPTQVKDILADYDRKIAEQAALKNQNESLAAQAAAQKAEAAEKLAKIEMAKADPLQFLAEAGITDAEWQQMLRGGGELSPEQKRIKELEAKIDGFMEQTKQKEVAQTREALKAQARAHLQTNPLARKMANEDTILAKQEELSQKSGKPVSLQDAVNDLTNTYKQGVMNLLKDPEIAAMFSLSVPKPQSDPAVQNSPTTLGSKLASSTSPSDGRPAPNDWAAKKALALKLLDAMKRNQ